MQVRRIVNMLAVGSIVVGTTTACATKKFVRTEVEAVGTRVETLSQSLEATQEATRQNQARITQGRCEDRSGRHLGEGSADFGQHRQHGARRRRSED